MNDVHLPESVLQTHRFANGLQVVGHVMPEAESVALAYYVHTGARDEQDPKLEGISHFLEHMLFKGTETMDRAQFDNAFTRIGARRNGYTSTEVTFYYVQILPEHLERAMELLSDMMYPRLREQEFEAEKAVILNEIARSEDQPYSFALRQMLRTYFGTLPLGNNVLGTRESIREMQLAQMRSYWHERYAANKIVLSIAGNFRWEEILFLAERYVSGWHAASSSERDQIIHYDPVGSSRHVIVDQARKQQIVMLAMPMVARESSDYTAAQLGASILGRSKGSRLYWQIVHRGLAVSASTSAWAMKGTGILLLQANSTPANARQVLHLLQAELDRLLEEGPTKEELLRAKSLWNNEFLLSTEYPYAQMNSHAFDWLMEKRLITLEEWLERIEQVTTEDVLRVFQSFPLREKQVFTAYGPLSEQDLCL